MNDELKELLEQRSLVQRQLAWFDARIAALRSEGPETEGLEPGEPAPAPDLAVSSVADSPAVAREATARGAGIATGDTTVPEPLAGAFTSEPTATIRVAKLGCLLWVAVASVVSIGLFILIYALYPEWDEETAQEKLQNLRGEEEQVNGGSANNTGW